MVYTTDLPLPKFVTNNGRGARMFRNKHAIPAFGIMSGDGSRPGRKLKEGVGEHLTQEDLTANMQAILKHEVDIAAREQGLDRFYLFALNDPRVATMATTALREAFDSLPDGRR